MADTRTDAMGEFREALTLLESAVYETGHGNCEFKLCPSHQAKTRLEQLYADLLAENERLNTGFGPGGTYDGTRGDWIARCHGAERRLLEMKEQEAENARLCEVIETLRAERDYLLKGARRVEEMSGWVHEVDSGALHPETCACPDCDPLLHGNTSTTGADKIRRERGDTP